MTQFGARRCLSMKNPLCDPRPWGLVRGRTPVRDLNCPPDSGQRNPDGSGRPPAGFVLYHNLLSVGARQQLLPRTNRDGGKLASGRKGQLTFPSIDLTGNRNICFCVIADEIVCFSRHTAARTASARVCKHADDELGIFCKFSN